MLLLLMMLFPLLVLLLLLMLLPTTVAATLAPDSAIATAMFLYSATGFLNKMARLTGVGSSLYTLAP